MLDELIKRLREHNGWALNKTLNEAADAIEELMRRCEQFQYMPPPAWIPVTERLPEEWKPVLGLIQYCEKEPPKQLVLWYLGNGHWRETWRGDMIVSAVTHWMPLPEAAKGGRR